jgi:uncharacterized protein (DUF2267 family)
VNQTLRPRRAPAPALAAATATAEAWTAEVDALLGRPGPEAAFRALRGVLHAFQRRLAPAPAAALSAALPTLLRGVFHEPLGDAARAGLLADVDRATRRAVRAEEAVRAVCAVLARRLPAETWAAVRAGLPSEAAALLAVPPRPPGGPRRPVR